jgi:hypothetical protein
VNIGLAQAVARAFIEANVPLHLWGPAGAGKSTFLEDLVQDELKYHLVDLRLATQEVGDLIGIPYTVERFIKNIIGRDEDGKPIIEEEKSFVTCWAAPSWLAEIFDKAAEGIPTVIFADEMDRAPKEVIQAFYQLVTKKQLHEHVLPPETRIVAAGNPPTEDYMVDTFDIAMLTRWGHVMVDPDPQTWLEQFGPKCDPSVSGFIAVQPGALARADSKWDVNTVSYPTPRGWEFVDRIYRTLGMKDAKLLQVCVGAVVGRAAASQFMASLEKDWVKVEDILSGKATIESMQKDNESNIKFLRLAHEIQTQMSMKQFSIGKAHGDRGMIEKRKERFCNFIAGMCKVKKELVIAACKVLGHREPDLMRLMLVRNKEIGEVTKILSSSMRNMF